MLTVYGGPMFAGKTTALLAEAKRLAPGTFLLVKPKMDKRFGVGVVGTHDGAKVKAMMVSHNRPRLDGAVDLRVKTILLDELNFFEFGSLWREIKDWMKRGIDVVGAGLMYDFRKQPFGATLPLGREADSFVELFARCDNCGGKANHSYRKVEGQKQVLVGSEESYGACCGSCWEELNGDAKIIREID